MSATAAAPALQSVHNPRTQTLLHGPIVATLLRLAWPNVLVMLVQASTGLIETWFVSRLGTDALAGMALVFPGFMMMRCCPVVRWAVASPPRLRVRWEQGNRTRRTRWYCMR